MRPLFAIIVVVFLAGCSASSERDAAFDAYHRGNYVPALKIIRPLAEAGDGWAQFMLGKAYAAGNGVKRDVEAADRWFARAVKSGRYQYSSVGDVYAEGQDAPKDLARGILWYEAGVRAGDRWSLHSLGVLYQFGQGVPVDYAKAFDYHTRALAAGAVVSHDSLAQMYGRGQGRPVDWERAVHHWKVAALAGSVVADWELGDYYSDPELGGQDLAQAEHHYLRSARSGNFFGLHKLGTFYRDRVGKPREALKWWKVAIRKGAYHFAGNIGHLFDDGLLPAEDSEATALAWYTVAVEHGADYEKPKVAELRGHLVPDRLRAAARQAAVIRTEFGLRTPPRAGR